MALVGTERKPPPADALAEVGVLLGRPASTDRPGVPAESTAPDRPGDVDPTSDDGQRADARDSGETSRGADRSSGWDGEAEVPSGDRSGEGEAAGGGPEAGAAEATGAAGGGDEAGTAEATGATGATGAATVGRGAGELAVVTAAGVVAAYRRVGLVVEQGDAGLPEAAPVDERAEASPTAAQLLSLLLAGHVRVLGGPTELIEDWLERCASSDKRPPARLLPALLDHATRVLALRPAVTAAGGPRVAWLAVRNPLWAWAEPAADEPTSDGTGHDAEVWRTGEPGARLAVLAARRTTDPAGARSMVEETWAGEKAKDRAQILEVLRTGLGPDDEAFLEARLDDRAPSVRAVAADLLATLPGSQLAQRMTERLRPLVARRRRRLEVALPDPPDAAARRDGIVDTGAPPATGRRTWWLIQLVGATPLAFWTGGLGLSPAEAVKQAQQHELIEGWVLAASRHGDPTWCHELLRVAPDPRLLRALPGEQARDLLPVALERANDAGVAGLLIATPAPWPELLSRWVVHRLRANKNAVSLDRSLTRLATAGDAAIIPDLERWIDELRLHDRLRTTLRDVAHTLSIRRTIAQELS